MEAGAGLGPTEAPEAARRFSLLPNLYVETQPFYFPPPKKLILSGPLNEACVTKGSRLTQAGAVIAAEIGSGVFGEFRRGTQKASLSRTVCSNAGTDCHDPPIPL